MTSARPLYDLLPAAHRARDALLGHPLRSLLEVVEEEVLRLREDVDGLYDDWFIETCAERVVPYIGDLLGVETASPPLDGGLSRRAFVANTIRHRRRKGTPAGLETLARDVTGWPAHVVEYFQLLVTTQHLQHPRPGNLRSPDLRDIGRLDLLGTAFDPIARTVDVRHADRGRGRHNIPSVGLHLWPLSAYPYTGADARAVDAAQGRWTFDPAGRSLPLFTRPRTGDGPGPSGVPAQLRRLALHKELTALRDRGEEPVMLAEPGPVFRITPDGHEKPVGPARLICADLTEWTRPPAGGDEPWVAVDPVLGRFTLPPGMEPERVRVDFSHGFPGDIGAGPHDRRATLAAAVAAGGTPWPARADWQMGVSRDGAAVGGRVAGTIGEAVRAWNARQDPSPGQVGVIAVLDSATYHEDLTGDGGVVIPPGNRLLLVAAVLPAVPASQPADGPSPGPLVAAGPRPHLVGSIDVTAPGGHAGDPGELVLNGLSIEGNVTVAAGDLDGLTVSDCTLSPGRAAPPGYGGFVRADGNPRLTIRLTRSICAGMRTSGVPRVSLADSIVHAGADVAALAVDAVSADVEADGCTVLGRTRARSLVVSDTILRGRAEVTHRQLGYLRFSYAPLDSAVPRRYRCQPADAATASRVAPRFTSTGPDDPGFCLLSADCPGEISTGAEGAGEMGAFRFLRRPWRMAGLAAQLDRYLRFGLEAGVFLAD
ncbi:phage tail protein [Microbispora sp. NPDC049125]|uniref:phage tail protein n=1 Tax=Microbispora sp. NPDC049125 TaxID=3154929 RepID=UPI003465F575